MADLATVLVTGDKGYVGSVLTDILLRRGYLVTGFDTGYYRECFVEPSVTTYSSIERDIRCLLYTSPSPRDRG